MRLEARVKEVDAFCRESFSLSRLTPLAACLVRSWTAEQTDEARGAFGMAGRRARSVSEGTRRTKFGEQLVACETGRQLFRIQIRGDQGERVMMRRAARSARTLIGSKSGAALAADVFLRGFADFVLREPCH